MSRKETRARRRRARIEQAVAEFSMARSNPVVLKKLLSRLAASAVAIWPIAEAASRIKPLDEAERAMIAHFVAPHLVSTSSWTVRLRKPVDDAEWDGEQAETMPPIDKQSQVSSIRSTT